jgi:hypothetical protein
MRWALALVKNKDLLGQENSENAQSGEKLENISRWK